MSAAKHYSSLFSSGQIRLVVFGCAFQAVRRLVAIDWSDTVTIILDYSTGFGGKYGVQKDRVDKVKLWYQNNDHWLMSQPDSV